MFYRNSANLRERKYPVMENDGICVEDSIEGLKKAGFKMIDNPIIMDNGHIIHMLINNKWWVVGYN